MAKTIEKASRQIWMHLTLGKLLNSLNLSMCLHDKESEFFTYCTNTEIVVKP